MEYILCSFLFVLHKTQIQKTIAVVSYYNLRIQSNSTPFCSVYAEKCRSIENTVMD